MEDMINQSKKRKTETLNDTVSLTQQDALKILQPLTKDQLISILQTLITHDVAALSAVRSIADTDPSHHKLFIRGIGWDTTTATLKSVFEQYGEVEEGMSLDCALEKLDERLYRESMSHALGEMRRPWGFDKQSGEGKRVMCKMAVDGKKGERVWEDSPRGPVPGLLYKNVMMDYSGEQNILVNPRPPHTEELVILLELIQQCGYASAVLLCPEYPGRKLPASLRQLPPIQGGFADSGNYGPSSGYPTQPNMPPAGPRGPHGGMYQAESIYQHYFCAKDGQIPVDIKSLAAQGIVHVDLGLISDQPLLLHGTGVLGLTLFVIATPSTGLILQV
ncbi:UBP1-associated protein 2C-like protein [Tanacetum coccineum]